ncbi:hypothetical protein GCM10008942_34610 [Rhizomicrobium electricum]|uniref:Uncharacterized protein n=1 Tax=Rhizomicrobium electricum TaxID=480070 RepID=A0ABN1F660_9PROT
MQWRTRADDLHIRLTGEFRNRLGSLFRRDVEHPYLRKRRHTLQHPGKRNRRCRDNKPAGIHIPLPIPLPRGSCALIR